MMTEVSSAPRKRIMFGRVVSNKMDKTIVVLVERRVSHKLYKKTIKRSKKMHAHDPRNECSEGDWVRIVETRPLSKTKTWALLEVVEKVK